MNNKALLIAGTVVAGVTAIASLIAVLDIEVVVEKPAPKRNTSRSSTESARRRRSGSGYGNRVSNSYDGGYSAPSYSSPSYDSFGGGSFDGGGSSSSY